MGVSVGFGNNNRASAKGSLVGDTHTFGRSTYRVMGIYGGRLVKSLLTWIEGKVCAKSNSRSNHSLSSAMVVLMARCCCQPGVRGVALKYKDAAADSGPCEGSN